MRCLIAVFGPVVWATPAFATTAVAFEHEMPSCRATNQVVPAAVNVPQPFKLGVAAAVPAPTPDATAEAASAPARIVRTVIVLWSGPVDPVLTQAVNDGGNARLTMAINDRQSTSVHPGEDSGFPEAPEHAPARFPER